MQKGANMFKSTSNFIFLCYNIFISKKQIKTEENMKIKITYADNEIEKANEIELALKNIIKSQDRLKIRKPQQKTDFHHTYMTIGKLKI